MILEPLDPIHRDCLAARDEIRLEVHRIRTGIHAWQPQPYEPVPTPTETENRK